MWLLSCLFTLPAGKDTKKPLYPGHSRQRGLQVAEIPFVPPPPDFQGRTWWWVKEAGPGTESAHTESMSQFPPGKLHLVSTTGKPAQPLPCRRPYLYPLVRKQGFCGEGKKTLLLQRHFSAAQSPFCLRWCQGPAWVGTPTLQWGLYQSAPSSGASWRLPRQGGGGVAG